MIHDNNLDQPVKIDYSKITIEDLTKIMDGLDREVIKIHSDYVMWTSSVGVNQFNKAIRNHKLIETLKNL